MTETSSLMGQYRQMHAEGKFDGYTTLTFKDQIKGLIDKHGAKTIVDYGCGKGYQYSRLGLDQEWGVSVRLYDPAVPGFTVLPEMGEGCICVDVMEHIPENDVKLVLGQVLRLGSEFVFFVICTRPSKKNLPDGRNCHLTIKDHVWWTTCVSSVMHRLGMKEKPHVVVEFRDGL